ncbi:hypothetical protein CEE39_07865 [bacterium (candidate division B38) B3_B38]|nr:MAG: hypothetical protein CEE39_07865 [bacterium (candidate division B38) B3_B38]
MKLGLALALWLIAVVVAIGNGYVGDTYIAARLGEYGGHAYKTVVLVVVIFVMGWLYARRTQGAEWFGAALGAGLLWLGLTIIFEFIFGHYVVGHSWDTLLADYRIWQGRLWALVLFFELVSPLIMGWRLNR